MSVPDPIVYGTSSWATKSILCLVKNASSSTQGASLTTSSTYLTVGIERILLYYYTIINDIYLKFRDLILVLQIHIHNDTCNVEERHIVHLHP